MQNFQEMSDYQLCYHKNDSKAIEVLYKRYKPYIYKYSSKTFYSVKKKIELEDVFQEYTIDFLNTIHNKIKLHKIKDKNFFRLHMYLYRVFKSTNSRIFNKYRDVLNQESVNLSFDEDSNYDKNILVSNKLILTHKNAIKKLSKEDINYNNITNEDKKVEILFNVLEEKLTEKEYNIIYRFYVNNETKTSIGKSYGKTPNLFDFHFNKIQGKIRQIILNDLDLKHHTIYELLS